MAARLTERLILHATKPRQSSTQAPRKAKQAPTAMKTVPSGSFDFCINGASAVKGMTSVGMPAPSMVGRPVRWKALPEVVAVPEEAAVVEASAFVVCADEAVIEVAEDAVEDLVVCVAVERSGRSLSCACAMGSTASASRARACFHRDIGAIVGCNERPGTTNVPSLLLKACSRLDCLLRSPLALVAPPVHVPPFIATALYMLRPSQRPSANTQFTAYASNQLLQENSCTEQG